MKQEELRSFLLQNGWREDEGNTLVFSGEGMQGYLSENHEVWLFLDEGGCCGGRRTRFFVR